MGPAVTAVQGGRLMEGKIMMRFEDMAWLKAYIRLHKVHMSINEIMKKLYGKERREQVAVQSR